MRAGPMTFTRVDDGRVLAGVAGGFARQHGVDPAVVRGALVLLSFVGGLGLVLYALGAVVAEPGDAVLPAVHPRDHRRDAAVVCVTLGLLLVVRTTGLWLGDQIMAPLVVVIAGVVMLGHRVGGETGRGGQLAAVVAGRHTRARLMVGCALVAIGLAMVGLVGDMPGPVRVGVFASALSVVGVAIVFGPWIGRVVQTSAEERRERIRAQEREAMAAHLHDSVLQTLALIQRTADDPRRTATLARQQERELRAWLYGTSAPDAASFGSAIEALARDVEFRYDVHVEAVVVGDDVMDDRLVALLAAAREACVNAAKHSGDTRVSLYVEVGADEVEVYVRDRGEGFDRDAIGEDRQGIAKSIEARVTAIGGTATVDSRPGQGTEVRLAVPRRPAEGRVVS